MDLSGLLNLTDLLDRMRGAAPAAPPPSNPMGGYRSPYDAPMPQPKLGVLPDGTRVPPEVENAYWEEQHRKFARDVLGLPAPSAPTRAAMRAKLASQPVSAPAPAADPSMLYAPVTVNPDRPIPNAYNINEPALFSTAREKHPWLTKGMNDADLRKTLIQQLPSYGVDYKNGVAKVDPSNASFQDFQKDMPLELYSKPAMQPGGFQTNWGGQPTGPALPPRAAVAPQSFADLNPIVPSSAPMQQASSPMPSPRMPDYPAPMPSGSPAQSARQNFNQAFAAARAQGLKQFPWTNPATGRTEIYTTDLG